MKKRIIIFLILIAVVWLWLKYAGEHITQVEKKYLTEKDDTTQAHNHSDAQAAATLKLPAKQAPVVDSTIPKTAGKALARLTKTLMLYANYAKSKDELVAELESLGMNPVEQTDENADTGKMTIVRTQKTLKSTRYFHAQFFTDENENEVLQHMSFEFRPGANSFEKGLAMIQSQFEIHRPAHIDDPGFKAWKLDTGYIVWIKKMQKKDLDGDPFNAYVIEDIGTVRIALELDIH